MYNIFYDFTLNYLFKNVTNTWVIENFSIITGLFALFFTILMILFSIILLISIIKILSKII